MRKNKVLLKRAASLFTAFVILAGSATYAQEEQTSQEVLSQEILSESSSELSEELVNGTDPEILELTSETITESIEEQTQEAESESTQEWHIKNRIRRKAGNPVGPAHDHRRFRPLQSAPPCNIHPLGRKFDYPPGGETAYPRIFPGPSRSGNRHPYFMFAHS